MLPVVQIIIRFSQNYDAGKIAKFRECNEGSTVVEYGLLAAFVVGVVLSGSSYFTHEASAGENALLGVFLTPVASSSSVTKDISESKNRNRKRVLITE